jgi:hypothetical protein
MDRKPVAYFAGLAQAIVGPLVVLILPAKFTLPVASDSAAWRENIAEGKQERTPHHQIARDG